METNEQQEELQWLYNTAQAMLIQYMLKAGVIKDVEEYAENYAEAFELLAGGELKCPRKMDWHEVRFRAQEVLKKIKSIII